MYLRKLSNGVNPLNDETLGEGDVCKQERISKCLLYVADYLQPRFFREKKRAMQQEYNAAKAAAEAKAE